MTRGAAIIRFMEAAVVIAALWLAILWIQHPPYLDCGDMFCDENYAYFQNPPLVDKAKTLVLDEPVLVFQIAQLGLLVIALIVVIRTRMNWLYAGCSLALFTVTSICMLFILASWANFYQVLYGATYSVLAFGILAVAIAVRGVIQMVQSRNLRRTMETLDSDQIEIGVI